MSTTTYSGTLTPTTCFKATCGVTFGLDTAQYEALCKSHDNFYCPNGHGQHFTAKTDAEQERELRERAERNAQFWKERSESKQRELVSLDYRLRGTRGAMTKIRKRLAHGVCPCCHRTFKQLAAHMKMRHPDYEGGK